MTQPEFDLDRMGGVAALAGLVGQIRAAGDAARIMQIQGLAGQIERKSDDSPVTLADREVEKRLSAYLQERHPQASFLGEETGERVGDTEGIRFVVDPIDGTRAFMRGLDTWSVLVGVEYQGRPVVGVAYMPAVEEMFVAYEGGGARLNGEPLAVSKVDSLGDALVTHGGLEAFLEQKCAERLVEVARHCYSVRGFADFDGYRKVLLGQADAMIDPGVQPYDICAASILLKEAGGCLTSLEGASSIYEGSGLGSNGLIHQALLEAWATSD